MFCYLSQRQTPHQIQMTWYSASENFACIPHLHEISHYTERNTTMFEIMPLQRLLFKLGDIPDTSSPTTILLKDIHFIFSLTTSV